MDTEPRQQKKCLHLQSLEALSSW